MRFARLWTVAGAALLLLGLGFAGVAAYGGEAGHKNEAKEHGLWSRECVKSADGKHEACFVHQFVAEMPQKAVLLEILFGYIGPDQRPRMVLTVPLGVLLPPGLRLTLDGGKPLAIPLETCTRDGCRAIVDLDDGALAKFRDGKQLVVRYVVGGGKAIELPVKLEGLNAALKTVAPRHGS